MGKEPLYLQKLECIRFDLTHNSKHVTFVALFKQLISKTRCCLNYS